MKRFKEALGRQVTAIEAMKLVQPLNDGRLAIRFMSKQQQDAVLDRLELAGQDIRIAPRGRHRPKITLTGVIAGYNDQEVLNALYDENEDLRQIFGEHFLNETRVISTRKCRNDKRNNITIGTAPDIFKYVIRRETVNLDLSTVFVEKKKANQTIICFQCHKFGHVQRYCNAPRTCQHCGGPHQSSDCRHPRQDCANCREAGLGLEDRRHSARDNRCPVFIKREKLARENTLYR